MPFLSFDLASFLLKIAGSSYYIRSVKERTKPFFDRTLSVDRPLFESLRIFTVYSKNFQLLSNARSQKSLPQEATKIAASLTKAQEVVYKCSPGRSLWCLSPSYFNIIEFIQPIIYSLAAKGNRGSTHVKSGLRDRTALSPFSAQ